MARAGRGGRGAPRPVRTTVRVVVVDPDAGDVTAAVQLRWRATLGVAMIGSSLPGIRELVGGDDGSDGPATRVE